jgi:2-keto-4-pentenoate hydratase
MELNAEQVQSLAARLLDAYDRRTETPALTDELPDISEADAYHIQRALRDLFVQRGARVIGKKTGLTSRAKQQAMGVPEAIYGFLIDAYLLRDPGPVRCAELIHPRLETSPVWAGRLRSTSRAAAPSPARARRPSGRRIVGRCCPSVERCCW